MLRQLTVTLLAVLTVTGAGAQAGKIRISGTADIFVAPDVAQVVFSVTSEDPEQATAEQKAAAQVKEILDAIQALKLPKLQTRTPPSQTKKQEAWPPPGGSLGGGGGSYGGTPRKAGYVVGTVIEVWFEGEAVTLEAGVNKIMTIAQTHGAANIAPDITCRDLEAVRQKALAAATKLAIQRAQTMAKAAGVHITGYSYIGPCPETARVWTGNPTVFKGPTGFGGGYSGGWGSGGGAPPIIEVHNTQVSATVYVTATY
jgi:uncharacterized protein YggE